MRAESPTPEEMLFRAETLARAQIDTDRMLGESQSIRRDAGKKSNWCFGCRRANVVQLEQRYTSLWNASKSLQKADFGDEEINACASRVVKDVKQTKTAFKQALFDESRYISSLVKTQPKRKGCFRHLVSACLQTRQARMNAVVDRIDSTEVDTAYLRELHGSAKKQQAKDRIPLRKFNRSVHRYAEKADKKITSAFSLGKIAAAAAVLAPAAYYFRDQLAEVFSPASEWFTALKESEYFDTVVLTASTVAVVALVFGAVTCAIENSPPKKTD